MTALRAGLLVLSGSIAAAAAAGAWRDAPEPSVQRLVVACAAALVVPLLWPGAAQAAGRTGVRIGGWSGASAAFAVVLLAAAGGGRQAPARLASCGAMMLAVVAATLALAALIELAIRRRGRGNDGNAAAREVAGRAAALALMFVSALPLWLGPAAEWVWRDWPWAIDAVVAASPLTHLALASGNDLFRNPWLYDHANLATLSIAYPSWERICLAYACALLLLAGAVVAAHGRSGRLRPRAPTQPNPKEAG